MHVSGARVARTNAKEDGPFAASASGVLPMVISYSPDGLEPIEGTGA